MPASTSGMQCSATDRYKTRSRTLCAPSGRAVLSASIVRRCIGAHRQFNFAGGDLEFRDLAAWIERSVGQTVGAPCTRPVVRNENGVGADCLHHQRTKREIVAARGHCYPIVVFDPALLGQPRMQFSPRLWILVDERSDAPRLCARQILAHYSARSQIQRILVIDRIATRPPLRSGEVRLAVVRVELLVREKDWRARMVETGTGPKYPFLPIDALISDAIVIGHSAARGDAQLFQNIGRILKRKILTPPQTMRDVNNDVRIAARLTRWIDALLPVDDAAFGAASKPVFLFMQTPGENYVRMMRRL